MTREIAFEGSAIFAPLPVEIKTRRSRLLMNRSMPFWHSRFPTPHVWWSSIANARAALSRGVVMVGQFASIFGVIATAIWNPPHPDSVSRCTVLMNSSTLLAWSAPRRPPGSQMRDGTPRPHAERSSRGLGKVCGRNDSSLSESACAVSS